MTLIVYPVLNAFIIQAFISRHDRASNLQNEMLEMEAKADDDKRFSVSELEEAYAYPAKDDPNPNPSHDPTQGSSEVSSDIEREEGLDGPSSLSSLETRYADEGSSLESSPHNLDSYISNPHRRQPSVVFVQDNSNKKVTKRVSIGMYVVHVCTYNVCRSIANYE
jgi:hypothetical protein